MKLKDLFKSTKSVKSSGLDDMAAEVESQEYIESFGKDKVRFMPNVDYSDPKNFAFYGSAEKYYTDAFVRIKGNYPYDGSQKEKYDWFNESTFLDLYIFEHRYPRFNGYVNFSHAGWGTLNGSLIGGYGRSNTNEYIKTFGGPNESSKTGLTKQFDDANKYATASLESTSSVPNGQFRESNLNYNLDGGVSLEMWLKKPAFDAAKTEKEVLFDLWNGEATNSAQYGRFTLELTGAATGSPFLLTAYSGTTGFAHQAIGANITKASITDWTHIAITAKNSGSDVALSFYVNGALNQTSSVSSVNLGHVTGSLTSFIGALQAPTKANTTLQLGAGKFSGSIDEFRYWKTERTSKQVGRYYWTNFGGGTNTDEANTDLGVYYKFNEGITGVAATDAVILDYSGRVSNGTWTGYASGGRSTNSAIVESSASATEFKDPTIYSTHPEYISTLQELEASGSIYDIENNASLINSMPSWVLEEDNEKEGNLRNLTQAMSSYFDNLYLHIQELNSLKDVYAHFQTNTIDDRDMTSVTGSTKPLPFADRLLTNAGFVAPELFADATVIEALATRSEDEHYEMTLQNVKNQIYQNVYSSLINVYKRKGTNKSFRNILHSFGIDENIVKVNFYGDNVDFELNDRHSIRTTKQKFVDFNHPDRFAGTVYQYAQGTDSVNYITGSTGNMEKYIPITFETQVILPNKIPWNEVYGFGTPFTKSVIAGMHEANHITNYTIPSPDNCDIQLYTVRDELESKNVKFHLKSTALGIHLISDLYPNMYDNNEWLLAFRITNDKNPSVDSVAGSTTLNGGAATNYTIDFLGYNTEGTNVLNSFKLSSAVTAAKAQAFLTKSKRIYAGAKRTAFTGGLEESSDHRIGFVRYWMNHLSDTTLLQHSYDSSNYGAESPFRSAYLMENDVNDIKIPEIDTLILNWDFETLSTSDSSGQFFVTDVTSGSGTQRYAPAFENIKRKFYHGLGDKFLVNDEKVIDVSYINAAKVTFPEVLQGDDMIDIRTQDDLMFTRNTLPQDYFIAFEKSMSQTISQEMLKFMSSVTDFNNLIGRPVDFYRMEYKSLAKLRQLFFERVSNEQLDLDKYMDYYKWLDDALGEMLVALVPASLAHSDGINNVVENHVFDRDKYRGKFPTIEFRPADPEGCMKTINRHLYPWETGHAPLPLQEDDNCYWWLNRAERTSTGGAITPAGLPANSLHVTEEGEVWYNFSQAMTKIKVFFDGQLPSDFSMLSTALETRGWTATSYDTYSTTAYGFEGSVSSQSGATNIPAGNGILFRFIGEFASPIGISTTATSEFLDASGNSVAMTYKEPGQVAATTTNYGNQYTRQKVFQARNSQLRRSWCTAQHFAVDKQRHLHGGTNYAEHKKRDYIWSATRDMSESPLDFNKFGGYPLRYILTNSDMYMALKDCDDPRLVTEKIKRAFGAYDGYDTFMHFHSGSHPDGKMKGGMVMPFNVMSSSVLSGYSELVANVPAAQNDPGGAKENIDIVNLHSDTIDGTNAVPMQGPFAERWVGGHQSRHAPINRGTDVSGSRAEGYRVLLGNILHASGSIGIVGPDYPYPHANQTSHPFFYKHQPKARYFREERAKRPLNIRNIRTTLDSTRTITSDYVGGTATIHLNGKSQTSLATAIRSLFISDIDLRFADWTISTVGNLGGGKGFTIEAPTDSEVYNFENVTTNLSNDITTTVTNGNLGGTKSKLQIVVESSFATIANNATWSFKLDTNGIDGVDSLANPINETFTLTFKTAAGIDNTGWLAASSTVANIDIGAVVGNFQKNYQPVHTFNRSAQRSRLRDLELGTNVHNTTNTQLPQTTQEASMIARGVTGQGNVMSNFHTSSLYLADVKTTKAAYADHEATGSGESIIVNRFSAPGGFETMSEVFLNLYGKEKSVYNALPFRNMSVRKDSGEPGSITVIDIHGNRRGIDTHLARHASQFGIDSVVGTYADPKPSLHKTNRNSKFFKQVTTPASSTPTATATLYGNSSSTQSGLANAIRALFVNDTSNFANNGWTIGAMNSSNHAQNGYRFTITQGTNGSQYNFSNLSDAFSQYANEVDTSAVAGASNSPASMTITVMGRWNQVDGESITFNVDLDGTGGATAFTLNFTDVAGTNSTTWAHAAAASETTANKYRYDNGYVTHQIPQSDYQYQWVMLSHTASYATSSLSRHILSDYSEPKGATSVFPHEELDVVVHSQSCLSWHGNYVGSSPSIERIDYINAYGFPTWEQIRNNDRNKNVILKKKYGYNIVKELTLDPIPAFPSGTTQEVTATYEESRMTENIPNTVDVAFRDSEFQFTYPYVNMRYHFDNKNLINEYPSSRNETMYESLYGVYSQDSDFIASTMTVNSKSVNQIVFPRFLKHTKYFDRHRHYFTSHYWTDGENDAYNIFTGVLSLTETGSYHRLDELGRREVSITATLFGTSSLNSLSLHFMNTTPAYLTNIIPSQSIWSMDSRTYFTGGASTTLAGATTGLSTTGWDPVAAASNSAGAPGVLQNQDHHFHNGISDEQLIKSGSGATGSFEVAGATRFATAGVSTFTSVGAYVAPVAATAQFTAKGQSTIAKATAAFSIAGQHVAGTNTTGEFTFAAGAYNAATKSQGSFDVSDTRTYAAATQGQFAFRIKGFNVAEAQPTATFKINGIAEPATTTQGSFKIGDTSQNGTGTATYQVNGGSDTPQYLGIKKPKQSSGYTSNYDTLAGSGETSSNTTDYVWIKFVKDGTGGVGSGTDHSTKTYQPGGTGPKYYASSVNPVIINTRKDDLNSAAAFWNKVEDVLNFHQDLRSSGDITVQLLSATQVSTDADGRRQFNIADSRTGLGHTKLIRTDDVTSGQPFSVINSSGGTVQIGVVGGQFIHIPYYKSAGSAMTASFEVSVATGNSPGSTNFGLSDSPAGTVALPALSSSAQTWSSTAGYTVRNNTELWDTVKSILEDYDGGKFGDNYDISYSAGTGGSPQQALASFSIVLKTTPPYSQAASSWNGLQLVPDTGDDKLANTDFTNYSAPCGISIGDYFTINNVSNTFKFIAGSSNSYNAGTRTQTFDADGITSAQMWNNLQGFVEAQFPTSDFTVTKTHYNAGEDGDNCNDYADFLIRKDVAGSYNFAGAVNGSGFSNNTNTVGQNVSGFGSAGGSHNITFGSTLVASAHASDNTGTNVSRAQSQANIIARIIASIKAADNRYDWASGVVASGTGNARTFTVTANNTGAAGDATITANGVFNNNLNNIAGGSDLTGLGTAADVTLKLRKGSDFNDPGGNVLDNTAHTVHIIITDSTNPSHDTTSITNGYDDATVYINVTDGGLNTNDALYDKIKDAIHLHADLDMNAVRGTGGNAHKLTVTSTAVGGGNSKFYTNDQPSQVTRTPNDTGGTGGAPASGAQNNDYVQLDDRRYVLDTQSRSDNTSGNPKLYYIDATNSNPSALLETAINSHGVWTVTGITGNPKVLSLQADAYGTAANDDLTINAGGGGSFIITSASGGGAAETGIADGDSITIKIWNGATNSAATWIFEADGFNNHSTGASPYYNVSGGTIYFNSARSDVWAILEAAIESRGDGSNNLVVTQNSSNPRQFTVASYIVGANGNSPDPAGNGSDVGDSFVLTNNGRFSGGVNDSGAKANDNLSVAGTTFTVIHGSAASNVQFRGDVGSNATYWDEIEDHLELLSHVTTVVQGSDNPRTFTVTHATPGTANPLNINSTTNTRPTFGNFSNTPGANESGAQAGDTLVVTDADGDAYTFTIQAVNPGSETGESANNSKIGAGNPSATRNQNGNRSPITDAAFWDQVKAKIQAVAGGANNLVSSFNAGNLDNVVYNDDNSDLTASFTVKSQRTGYTDPFTNSNIVTGSNQNGNITKTGSRTFHNISTNGLNNGTDGVFRGIKFQEIIPQPRYNYPHALQSPGSMRCPTGKSNLGLIDVDYKMRSNHFALTRSLGFDEDGLYDNTSRWTTPDLSGLTPMDDDYNEWYEKHRGQNKHFSLVPEYRVSSHVEGIISTGMDENAYFGIKDNFWLELTGASMDHGATMASNAGKGSQAAKDFLMEFSTTSYVKNLENFIEDNAVPKVDIIPLKLTLTCESINSFLPYEGFYPQVRTVQMCEAFAKSYGKGIVSVEADPDNTDLIFPDNNPIAQTRPIFDAIMSPGLLYNTIKSGIAVDYPVVHSKMATASLSDPYGGTNYMVKNEYFDDRLPFETLLSPESFMQKRYLVDVNPHISSSMNVKAMLGAATNPNYKLMSHNFFAETMEFFLEKGRSSRIVSMPETAANFGNAKEGTIYKAIFRVFKSKKQHPYVEFSGASDIISQQGTTAQQDRAEDLYYNRPPSGTNYFLREFAGKTGADLEYNIKEINYPRPNMNPWAEVETIMMYSQPNAFGPPCAGGVAVEYAGRNESDVALTGENNNTTYMMYDSTNGYNAPFTPPYYDGEGWAIMTFTPLRSGKHTLDEIIQNTDVKYLRYEINHESGSYGDRGTYGPQGFSMNENAMQADAPFNLFKRAVFVPPQVGSTAPEFQVAATTGDNQTNNAAQTTTGQSGMVTQSQRLGSCWVIESKFETPILDFSKYVNREYNAVMESATTSNDIYVSYDSSGNLISDKISLSGSRNETPSNSADRLETKVHSSLASVHKLRGALNPIGMWHQYGDFPKDPDKGIFMQMIDVPPEYIRFGTEMTIPNPKWIVIKPRVTSCIGKEGLDNTYEVGNTITTLGPYVPKQENRRRMEGDDQFAVCGTAIQVIDEETGRVIDTEIRDTDLYTAFGVNITDQTNSRTTTNAIEGFKLFDVFRDRTIYSKAMLTDPTNQFNASVDLAVYRAGVSKNTEYPSLSTATSGISSVHKGHWAASYYNYDQAGAYAPLLIAAKNYDGLKFDYGDFNGGLFEEFLKDFSIGVTYKGQSSNFSDGEEVSCATYTVGSRTPTVFAPKVFVDAIERINEELSITNLAKIDMTDNSKIIIGGLIEKGIDISAIAPTSEAKKANSIARTSKKNTTTFRSMGTARKKFKLIPPIPDAASTAPASSVTQSYNYPEPQFVRASIRYNAGAPIAGAVATQRGIGYFNKMVQYAPQTDRNIASNPSTVRWGRFMHNNLDPRKVLSLADLVGFNKAPVKMGITSKKRILNEAVVAMPYIMPPAASDTNSEENGVEPQFVPLDPIKALLYLFRLGLITAEEAAERLDRVRSEIENSESEQESGSQRGTTNGLLEQLTSTGGEFAGLTFGMGTQSNPAADLPDSSVVRQIGLMGKYVFPPHLDFVNYDVNPLAMYIFEFSKELDRNDLNDLWQGVRSENVKKIEMQTRTITHQLNADSLLGRLKIEDPSLVNLKDIKWRIFKVKLRANTNYDKKMRKDLLAENYLTEEGKSSFDQMKIGYNWPYDYFSLVENVKMKVNIELGKEVVEESPSETDEYDGPSIGGVVAVPEIGSDIPLVSGGQQETDEDGDGAGLTAEAMPGIGGNLVNIGSGTSASDLYTKVVVLIGGDDDEDDDTGGGGGGRKKDASDIQFELEDTNTDVQGSGGGSGYGGSGGGGVGQGTDGIDDDY